MKVPTWSARELEIVFGLRKLGAIATLDPGTRAQLRAWIGTRLAKGEGDQTCAVGREPAAGLTRAQPRD